MKKSFVLLVLLSVVSLFAAPETIIVSTSEPMQDQTQTETVTVPSQASSINVTCPTHQIQEPAPKQEEVLEVNKQLIINVVGQGVAPTNTSSPAQAYALAKRAAVADAYRLIAERVKGVRVDGQDFIKNMMVKRSTVRTSVQAMVRNANIVETTFKEGLCEVAMEIKISHAQFQ